MVFGQCISREIYSRRKRSRLRRSNFNLKQIQKRNYYFLNKFYFYKQKIKVRNPGSSLCLDTLGKDEKSSIQLGVYFCQGGVSANQVFSLSNKDELRREDLCVLTQGSAGSVVQMNHCSGNSNEKWTHTKSGPIIHKDSGLCLDVTDVKNGEYAKVNKCNPQKPGQMWDFKNYSP